MNNPGAMNSFHKQAGVASLEFAFAGLMTLIIIFTAIEMGRLMFTLNTLAEATRRGARVAAVCTVDNPRIKSTAIFDRTGSAGRSPYLRNLTPDNIVVEYLSANGTVLAGASTSPTFEQIRYVRVRVQDFQYRMLIPGIAFQFTAPEFPTTIPRESLGIPKPNQTSTCV